MPGLNSRGPLGEGPMTGRSMGRCTPENKGKSEEEILQNRDSSRKPGQGFGRGLGLGRGPRLGGGQGLGCGRGIGRGHGFGHGRGMGNPYHGNA
jgi:hypothetical protein